jgi:exodeoxyribonuclease V alpha subunit
MELYEFSQSEQGFFEYRQSDKFVFYKDRCNSTSLAFSGSKLAMVGDKIKLQGSWTENDYGKTFWVKFQEVDTESKEYQVHMLAQTKGVTKERAVEIFAENGFSTVKQLCDYIKSGGKVKGIGAKKAEKIAVKLEEIHEHELKSKVCFLLGDVLLAEKICKQIYDIADLHKEPYKILKSCGIGFKRADAICLEKLNISLDNEERILYLTEYKFQQFNVKQANFIEYNNFYEFLSNEVDIRGDIASFIKHNELIVNDSEKVYLKDVYDAETLTPTLINMLTSNRLSINQNALDDVVKEYEVFNKMKLDITQIEAVKIVVSSNFSILTGSAGTGKSTVTDTIAHVLESNNVGTINLAPTGRAALRMKECIHRAAGTIHSLVCFVENVHSLVCFVENVLKTCDTWTAESYLSERFGIKRAGEYRVLIDEFSMVDQVLFHRLLKSINKINEKLGCHISGITVIGDPNQLPSVGCGRVLQDLIDCELYAHAHLTKTFRQKSGSLIIDNANKVNNRQLVDNLQVAEFYTAPIKASIIDRIYKTFRNKYDSDIEFYKNVQVIAPLRKTCDMVNDMYKKDVVDKQKFAIGDKVINRQNDNAVGICNGDMGIVEYVAYNKDYKRYEYSIYFYDNDIRHKFVDISVLQMAYCCTVHKSQGSEYKTVIIILDRHSMITDKNLLYTAITRAKQNCIILYGDEKILADACTKSNDWMRKTYFTERLLENAQM